jgi:tetratricopeptide (TPR) repeat protein
MIIASVRRNYPITLFFAVLTVFLCSCGDAVHKELVVVDSLLNQDLTDSAALKLDMILPSDIDRKEDKALYDLLLYRTKYLTDKPIENDRLINFSINYFKNTSELEKLADSYYYKGAVNILRQNFEVAIVNLKLAEVKASHTTNNKIKHKIMESLWYVNNVTNNKKISLSYAKKILGISRDDHNINWITYALIDLSSSYHNIGEQDSSLLCLQKCQPLLKSIPRSDRAYFYSNLGVFYINENPSKAQSYFQRAVKLNPISSACIGLADICFKRHQPQKAKTILTEALMYKDPLNERNIFQQLSEYYTASKRPIEALAYKDSIINLQDSILKEDHQKNITKIQVAFDLKMQQARQRQNLIVFLFILLMFILLTIIVYVYLKFRDKKLQGIIMQNQLLINEYQEKITQLQKAGSHEEVEKLKRQIEIVKKSQSRILYEGKDLYDRIEKGETVVKWNKGEFVKYIAYYKLMDLPFIMHLESDYDHLSAKNIFFAILCHLGKTDSEIQHIMGISAVTVRSDKSRIKAKSKLRK